MAHETDERETMGRRLASLRALKGWSQTEAAERAGIAQTYLSRLESGAAQKPPLQTVERLANLSGASLDYIVRGTASTAA